MKTITIDGVEYQLTPIPVQWEPKRLDENGKFWSIGGTGTVFSSYNINPSTGYERTSFGNYFYAEQEAKEAAKQVRQLLRLRAYVREFAPDWKANWNNNREIKGYVFFNNKEKKWLYGENFIDCSPTTIYMPISVAKSLAIKLNSGEVVL